jgi:hypothetical protein
VLAELENPMSTVLSLRNLGKLVPEIVSLSYPRTFNSVAGTIEVTVQSTSILAMDYSFGIDPYSAYTSGNQLPQTGASFKVHSILVADEAVAS